MGIMKRDVVALHENLGPAVAGLIRDEGGWINMAFVKSVFTVPLGRALQTKVMGSTLD